MEIRTDERGNLDAIWLSVDFRTHERGNSDARQIAVDFRTKSAAKSLETVQITTLVRQLRISHLTFISTTRDECETGRR